MPEELLDRRRIAPSGQPLGEYLQQVGAGPEAFIQCTWCGQQLARGGERWKDRVPRAHRPMSEAGRFRDSAPGIVLRQFYCPACATLLDSEVTLEQDSPLYDEVREWPRG